MLPKAYDEIQRLKGEEIWTRFIIQCVLAKVGDNSILQDELASLVKEPKAEKPRVEKPKKVKATRKGKAKVQEPAAEVTGEREPTEAEAPTAETTESLGISIIEAEAPTRERVESKGINTPPKKLKTFQELQAINKGEG